ncbi:hypothetical protein HPP92_010530 [Vanilla planifolia]|uniref:WW domain-containing protein n=1 Tax=Vanilla planifolia TaxID=51239 RepID=A0A835R3Y2_VANPL|nr:hypothetical protein HPP92_010530 [Vanilla planifolia]
MAAVEAAQTSLDPSFAPEDPSLPKPWKGLIDGSTSVLYYWNPETNVTQYEKPAGSAPPVPPGPPLASTLQLAPVITSNSTPSNGPSSQQPTEQKTFQQPFEHVQQLQQNQLQPSVQQIPLQQLHQQPYQQLQSVQGSHLCRFHSNLLSNIHIFSICHFIKLPTFRGKTFHVPKVNFNINQDHMLFNFHTSKASSQKAFNLWLGRSLMSLKLHINWGNSFKDLSSRSSRSNDCKLRMLCRNQDKNHSLQLLFSSMGCSDMCRTS